jgi:hypothetical protein
MRKPRISYKQLCELLEIRGQNPKEVIDPSNHDCWRLIRDYGHFFTDGELNELALQEEDVLSPAIRYHAEKLTDESILKGWNKNKEFLLQVAPQRAAKLNPDRFECLVRTHPSTALKYAIEYIREGLLEELIKAGSLSSALCNPKHQIREEFLKEQLIEKQKQLGDILDSEVNQSQIDVTPILTSLRPHHEWIREHCPNLGQQMDNAIARRI